MTFGTREVVPVGAVVRVRGGVHDSIGAGESALERRQVLEVRVGPREEAHVKPIREAGAQDAADEPVAAGNRHSHRRSVAEARMNAATQAVSAPTSTDAPHRSASSASSVSDGAK